MSAPPPSYDSDALLDPSTDFTLFPSSTSFHLPVEVIQLAERRDELRTISKRAEMLRHLIRFVMLAEYFVSLSHPASSPEAWRDHRLRLVHTARRFWHTQDEMRAAAVPQKERNEAFAEYKSTIEDPSHELGLRTRFIMDAIWRYSTYIDADGHFRPRRVRRFAQAAARDVQRAIDVDQEVVIPIAFRGNEALRDQMIDRAEEAARRHLRAISASPPLP